MPKRKKAAIITLYGEGNYGNKLQNYAIQKCLEQWGYHAETLVFVSLREHIKNLLKRAIAGVFPKIMWRKRPEHCRVAAFSKFSRKYLRLRFIHSQNHETPQGLDKKYSLFSVGSDQVWNPYNDAMPRIYDKMFLTFVPDEKKRCFSPSISAGEIPEAWQEPYEKGWKKFPVLTCREKEGAELMERLAGKPVAVTIDPTLMLDAKDWQKISCTVKNLPKHYVLDYFLGVTPKEKTSYQAFAEARERICLLDKANREIYLADPGAFVYLVSKADMIYTDSFHACVFAILFEKPVVVYEREGGNNMFSRLETLFSLFGVDINEVKETPVLVAPAVRDDVLKEKREELKRLFEMC